MRRVDRGAGGRQVLEVSTGTVNPQIHLATGLQCGAGCAIDRPADAQGVAQGIGQAAMERVVYDPESGQVLTGSMMDYQIPRADELPALTLETLPTNAPTHPLGIKGCGEAGAAGGAPAVMNALIDAIARAGGGGLEMPATPERVWRALRGKDFVDS